MKWPSPESVVRDLRSQDEGLRFRALLLIGVPEKLARVPVWSNTTPSAVVGSKVSKAEQVELRYAALGRDETQQAIVAAQVVGTYAFAAVAISGAKGWERIAAFSCWCKYDASNVMDTFVSLRGPGPQRNETGRYELVLRASGGGTGLYTQDEAHFRLYRGDMKAVISFVSRREDNPGGSPPPWYLTLERRWFDPMISVNVPEGGYKYFAVLVESQGKTVSPPNVYS